MSDCGLYTLKYNSFTYKNGYEMVMILKIFLVKLEMMSLITFFFEGRTLI